MTWTGWDVAVTVMGVLNAAVLIVAAVAGLKILRGPVAGVKARALPLLPRGLALASAGQRAFAANRGRIAALASRIGALRRLMSVDAYIPSPEGEPVTYRSVTNAFRTAQSIRAGLRQAQGMAQKVRGRGKADSDAAPPGPAGAKSAPRKRQSLAMRLGLIPPAARHLPTVLRAVRIARSTAAALQKRGGVG
jgi:hypothetical protein